MAQGPPLDYFFINTREIWTKMVLRFTSIANSKIEAENLTKKRKVEGGRGPGRTLYSSFEGGVEYIIYILTTSAKRLSEIYLKLDVSVDL